MNQIDEIHRLLEANGPTLFERHDRIMRVMDWDKEANWFDLGTGFGFFYHLTSTWSSSGPTLARLQLVTGHDLGGDVNPRHRATFGFSAEDIESITLREYEGNYAPSRVIKMRVFNDSPEVQRRVPGVPVAVVVKFNKLIAGQVYRVAPFAVNQFNGEMFTSTVSVWVSHKGPAEKVAALLTQWRDAATAPVSRFVDEEEYPEPRGKAPESKSENQAPGRIRRD